MTFDYDVIVVGAGHAGCEAAVAAARLGATTLLITMDMNNIAQMSCNPAVGGVAKGQIVREIDALGGMMGIVTDRSTIQFRMLNRSKGPAMWSPRAQADRKVFSSEWRSILENTPGLYLWQDTVSEIVVSDRRVTGVVTAQGVRFNAKAVVLTAGTFLNGLMHVGEVKTEGGRIAEQASKGLTEQLVALGFTADRMKTGTPMRIDERTIDFSKATVQEGDAPDDFHKFSFLPDVERPLPRRACYMVYTNTATHEILRRGLPRSPLYNGQIQSIGPRYCPSIETKIVTFADKNEHQLFLEPEGATTHEFYVNGFSSSLPFDVQLEAIQSVPALRDVHIFRPGYAIEYDFFDPRQLRHTLETKLVNGLYFAGQVNGTTGYEEAAGQGLVAGVNAARKVLGKDPFVLGRDEAYIGVLIDDLVTKGVDEPYRMFTSRAEFRILLRQDDADIRLTPRGREIGLVDDHRFELMDSKLRQRDRLIDFVTNHSVKLAEANEILVRHGSTPLQQGCKLADLVRRPEMSLSVFVDELPALRSFVESNIESVRREEILEAVETLIKYQGYIDREKLNADKARRLEGLRIKGKVKYAEVRQLSTEARQKLERIDPETIGQASRIPGISPADISILLLLAGR